MLTFFAVQNISYPDECTVVAQEKNCDGWYCFFKNNGKAGLYNQKSMVILAEAEYENIEYFEKFNSFILKKNNKYGIIEYIDYITPVEKIVILPIEYDSVERAGNNLAKIEKNGKFAIFDTDKKKSTKFYDDIKVESGEIFIKKNGKWKNLHPVKSAFRKLGIGLMFLCNP